MLLIRHYVKAKQGAYVEGIRVALTTVSVTRTQACSKCKDTDGMNGNDDTTHSTARDCADLPCADHAFEARRLASFLRESHSPYKCPNCNILFLHLVADSGLSFVTAYFVFAHTPIPFRLFIFYVRVPYFTPMSKVPGLA